MSFVTAIRDYVDFLNNIYDSVSGDLTLFQLGQHTLLYFFQSIVFLFQYILTFQWLQDLSNLPIIVPQISSAILKENLILNDPGNGMFSFFRTPSFETNKFLIGFFNSLFLSLPISCSHLIILRRLLVQGIPSGIAAGLGSIFGQFFFLAATFFGLRFLLIPWLSFDSIQYLFGLALILGSVYSMSYENVELPETQNFSPNVLLKMFALNFALAWTEQSCVFQYVGNLTFSGEPTILETLSGNNQVHFFLIHISYLLGILCGSLFFLSLFALFVYRFTFFVSNFYEFRIIKFSGTLYSTSKKKINFIILTSIIGLSLTSLPFYGLDYLLTKPLGFVSQDKSLRNTIFYPEKIAKPLLPNFAITEDSLNEPDTDIAPFDRARFNIGPDGPRKNTFEDLNYQGEHAWKRKDEIRKLLGKDPSNDFLLNFLKKGKNKNFSSEAEKNEIAFFEEKNIGDDILIGPEAVLLDYADKSFLFHNEIEESLEKEIKKKYYSNSVYKNLLSADIDFFLSRQPKEQTLTAEDEKILFGKRLLLGDYYDSLRFYQNISSKNDFENTFQGSKSYADRVYNQQFKGTLNIVRRLFAVTANDWSHEKKMSTTETSRKRVLKYDQPLYTTGLKKSKFLPFFHEELVSEVQSKDRLNTKEEVENQSFFESTQSTPFYAGWDNEQRKFIITNRFLPRSFAGYKKLQQENKGMIPSGSSRAPLGNFFQKSSLNEESVEFTAWPLNPKLLEKDKKIVAQNIPYNFLFQLENDKVSQFQKDLNQNENEKQLTYSSSLPTNIFVSTNNSERPPFLFEAIAPKRGGFIWPGHYEIKIK